MLSTEIGRLPASEVGSEHLLDNPSKAYSALLSKVDELIDALATLTAKLDSDGGVTDENYASSITDSVNKLEFRY